MNHSTIDSSIGFGLANFLYCNSDETSDATYTYVSYLTKKGSILIAKYKKDDTEARYYLTRGIYSTIWAGRAGFTYVLPTALAYPKV